MEDDWTNRGIRVDRQWSKQTIDAGLPSKAYYILMFFFFPNFYWRRCTFPGSCRAYEHFHVPKLILQKDIFNQDQVKKWKIIREMIEKDGRGRIVIWRLQRHFGQMMVSVKRHKDLRDGMKATWDVLEQDCHIICNEMVYSVPHEHVVVLEGGLKLQP